MRANGDKWDMPPAARDGLVKCKKAVKEAKAAVAAPVKDTRKEEAGTESSSHAHLNCVDCLALHECTLSQDNAFNARVNMLISPSHADAQAHSATTAAKAGIVCTTGAGAIAEAAEAVAAMAAASRAREETPVGGERQVSVLLDTGASGRNFISSKLASWLIERGSTTLNRSGEVGLAQQRRVYSISRSWFGTAGCCHSISRAPLFSLAFL